MKLQSQLFKEDARLNACAVDDAKHVTPGCKGEYVSRIQTAIMIQEIEAINGSELLTATYGPSTAHAVLLYKRKRSIINLAYQKTADNIVGRMTIQRLDQEMLAFETRARMAKIPV